MTMGGTDNTIAARKHFCKSIDLNREKNTRAWTGLLLCCQSFRLRKLSKMDANETNVNSRLLSAARTYVLGKYDAVALNEVRAIGKI